MGKASYASKATTILDPQSPAGAHSHPDYKNPSSRMELPILRWDIFVVNQRTINKFFSAYFAVKQTARDFKKLAEGQETYKISFNARPRPVETQ